MTVMTEVRLRGIDPLNRFKLRDFAHMMGLAPKHAPTRYSYSIVRDYRVGLEMVADQFNTYRFMWTVDGVRLEQTLRLVDGVRDSPDPNYGFDPDDIALLKTRIMVSMYASA